jgi:FtsP/CotA-like multicopper oxidase with cupredoxin domain
VQYPDGTLIIVEAPMSANKFPGVQFESSSAHLLPNRMSRRTFMCAAAASVGALALESIPLPAMAARGGGGTVTRYPLHVPPTVSPGGFTLTAAPAIVNLASPSSPSLSSALAYNGFLPGPTFRANKGDSVYVDFVNGLADDTTVHWHGMLVETDDDGQPQDLVPPGGSRPYEYPIVQRAALNWYHPHPHMMTGEQVCLGLAGAFIVNDAEEAALFLPSGNFEVPLIIRDANFDKAGNLIYNPRTTGFDGNTPLVNGTRNPYRDVDRAVYRFRVLNGANARLFRLVLSNGMPFTVIGNDGGLLATSVNVTEIEFSPGERLDLLVDFRELPGAHVMLRDLNSGWDLLEFRVANSTQITGTTPPNTLSTIAPLPSPALTRYFSFDGMSKINGREYDLSRIDFQVPFGQTERWVFTTSGNAPHPVHVHGASFQVQSRTGGRGRLFPWESGWKDTVLLHDHETVAVLIRFDQYRGRYLIHCHKLEHEDMGMMANFQVI